MVPATFFQTLLCFGTLNSAPPLTFLAPGPPFCKAITGCTIPSLISNNIYKCKTCYTLNEAIQYLKCKKIGY